MRPSAPSRMLRLGFRSSCAGHLASQPRPHRFAPRRATKLSTTVLIWKTEAEVASDNPRIVGTKLAHLMRTYHHSRRGCDCSLKRRMIRTVFSFADGSL